jgi:MFS family permease
MASPSRLLRAGSFGLGVCHLIQSRHSVQRLTARDSFPWSFGVFQNYYSTHEPFNSEPSGIAAISTTSSGIMFITSPLVAVLCQRFPRSRRLANTTGLAILTSALVAASFTNTTGALLATQGVLFGIGGVTLYFPAMYLIDEWFIARKGLAFAVIWTGSGIGGAVFPFVSQWLLDSYGFRTTLRVWAVIIASRSRHPYDFNIC